MSSLACPGCGLDAPLSEPCPQCEDELPIPAKWRVGALRAAMVKALDDLQAAEKQALAYKAAAYAENKGLTAMYREAIRRLNAIATATGRRPDELLASALELVTQRMREHQDMTNRLSQLETPVADMTPGGVARRE